MFDSIIFYYISFNIMIEVSITSAQAKDCKLVEHDLLQENCIYEIYNVNMQHKHL